MSHKPVRSRLSLALFVVFLSPIYGGTIVFSQDAPGNFYSNYDVRELVKGRMDIDFDCADGDASIESTSELRGGGSEKTKSASYVCRIKLTGVEAFDLAKFLEWLSDETIKQIESGNGTVITQRHKVGKRFSIEYNQQGFLGRVEVDGDMIAKNQISLDVEVVESSKK